MQTAIYALMSTLLFGPNYQSVFLLSDAKAEVYYVIEQPTREKEVWDILKEFNNELIAFDKGLKQRTKGLRELFLDPKATREDLLPLYEDAQEERAILQNEYFKDRIEVQDLLTIAEWQDLVLLSYGKFEKGRTGHDLAHAKQQLLAYQPLQKIRSTIEKTVADPDQRMACLRAEEAYQATLLDALDKIDDQMLVDIETLKRQDVSLEEMQEIAARLTEYRSDVFQATVVFRRAVLENTQPKEWNKVVKAMVKLI